MGIAEVLHCYLSIVLKKWSKRQADKKEPIFDGIQYISRKVEQESTKKRGINNKLKHAYTDLYSNYKNYTRTSSMESIIHIYKK